MKIDIVIKDVSVEVAQQIFALVGGDAKIERVAGAKTETIKTDAHLRFDCEWCGRKYQSQNSVNSHLKHCKDKPAKQEDAESEAVAPVKPAPKKEPKRRVIAPPKKKKKVAPKPTFNAPSELDLKKVVVTAVLNNGNDITSSAGIYHELAASLKKAQGTSEQLEAWLKGKEQAIAGTLRKLEAHLGAGQCMGMDLPDGYQIAIFADLGSLTLDKLLKAL
jgi:hypothetical protein